MSWRLVRCFVAKRALFFLVFERGFGSSLSSIVTHAWDGASIHWIGGTQQRKLT